MNVRAYTVLSFLMASSCAMLNMHAEIYAATHDPLDMLAQFQVEKEASRALIGNNELKPFVTRTLIEQQAELLKHDLSIHTYKYYGSRAAIVSAALLTAYLLWQDFKKPSSLEARIQKLEDSGGLAQVASTSTMRYIFSTAKHYILYAVPTAICQAALGRASNMVSASLQPFTAQRIMADKLLTITAQEMIQQVAILDGQLCQYVAQGAQQFAAVPCYSGDYTSASFGEIMPHLLGYVARFVTPYKGSVPNEIQTIIKASVLQGSEQIGTGVAYLIAFIESQPINPVFGYMVDIAMLEVISNHTKLHAAVQDPVMHASEIHTYLQALMRSLQRLSLFAPVGK